MKDLEHHGANKSFYGLNAVNRSIFF